MSTFINASLQAFQAQGPAGVAWQKAELAMFLVYSWSEFTAMKGECCRHPSCKYWSVY